MRRAPSAPGAATWTRSPTPTSVMAIPARCRHYRLPGQTLTEPPMPSPSWPVNWPGRWLPRPRHLRPARNRLQPRAYRGSLRPGAGAGVQRRHRVTDRSSRVHPHLRLDDDVSRSQSAVSASGSSLGYGERRPAAGAEKGWGAAAQIVESNRRTTGLEHRGYTVRTWHSAPLRDCEMKPVMLKFTELFQVEQPTMSEFLLADWLLRQAPKRAAEASGRAVRAVSDDSPWILWSSPAGDP